MDNLTKCEQKQLAERVQAAGKALNELLSWGPEPVKLGLLEMCRLGREECRKTAHSGEIEDFTQYFDDIEELINEFHERLIEKYVSIFEK